MEWFVDASAPASVSRLRREIADYLRRHAAEPAEVADAEVVVAELLSNVVRHAAGPAWVTLSWSLPHPLISVQDLGAGFRLATDLPADALQERGRGLFLVHELAREVRVAVRAHGGARVSAELAVERRPSPSLPPPRLLPDPLPRPEEAGAEGFPRDSFLRAVLVELARAVEDSAGPEAAEAVVAQVGASVGARMEAEFREKRVLHGRLSPAELGECLVRLKRAIGGGFSVVEANAERIVFSNDACPFGDVVRTAPSLCRMTSSVFGGIAATNCGTEASVVLEERIAVGDPCCRVVVYLDAEPPDRRVAHRYRGAGGTARDVAATTAR